MESSTGIELITQEREEQIKKHGWTMQHDEQTHDDGELQQIAMYILANGHDFPVGWEKLESKIKTKTQIEKLTIAGALIAAEIDRLLR